MFGAIIIQIGNCGSPMVKKLIMRIPTVEPVEAHVHGFGVFENDGIVCEPSRNQVICLKG